ncbi:uncharacterized protein si:dkey-171c9.3 [Melanotaenia boesemani]|uniref:uncharacterized protein si:dkey-171c9.3 n=1 Tax=Melanotaenia boesemani TaxID=1250792 RepID=UPI001C042095|nr:uncharacterized protein si:dkey-171c9.3 [Melanotaenia boesemani]
MLLVCTGDTKAVTSDSMQTVRANPRMPEPVLQSLGERSPLNTEVVEQFAQNMGESIIQSLLNQIEKGEPEMPVSDQEEEMLAKALASAVIEDALREACVAQNIKDCPNTDPEYAEMVSFVDKSGEKNLLDTDMDQMKDIQTSYHPPLSQSGLPVVGSLDYPDTPPTTPLIPELERSRHSFARKLKGGLAKVFLPSPPPPTPKDKEDDSGGTITDPQMELMEHLMHSLSTNDLARDSLDADPQHGASMEAFAEAMSCDIMDWVFSVKTREQIPDEIDLHLFAHQLTETIITSSLEKAKMLV